MAKVSANHLVHDQILHFYAKIMITGIVGKRWRTDKKVDSTMGDTESIALELR